MRHFDKDQLYKLYVTDKLNPNQIGEILSCNHKTVRKYLRLFCIPLRTASEFNFLSKASHENPTKELLESQLSIVGHSLYMCEGWHTEKTNIICFVNTDPLLIDTFINFLNSIYKVKTIRISIYTKTIEEANILLRKYPNAKVRLDPDRNLPLIRIESGGNYLARELIQNCYHVICHFSKPGVSSNFTTLAC